MSKVYKIIRVYNDNISQRTFNEIFLITYISFDLRYIKSTVLERIPKVKGKITYGLIIPNDQKYFFTLRHFFKSVVIYRVN